MKGEEALRNKHILAVDDEPDVLEYVGEELSMCLVDKAADQQTALEYIQSYVYDIVILDIMGVDGFRLLEMAVRKDFPTVMLTAHAITPKAFEKAIKLDAASFLPKDKMSELRSFLADVVLKGKTAAWRRLFRELGGFFGRKFGADWKTKHKFFQEFEEELKMPEERRTLRDSSSVQHNILIQEAGKNEMVLSWVKNPQDTEPSKKIALARIKYPLYGVRGRVTAASEYRDGFCQQPLYLSHTAGKWTSSG